MSRHFYYQKECLFFIRKIKQVILSLVSLWPSSSALLITEKCDRDVQGCHGWGRNRDLHRNLQFIINICISKEPTYLYSHFTYTNNRQNCNQWQRERRGRGGDRPGPAHGFPELHGYTPSRGPPGTGHLHGIIWAPIGYSLFHACVWMNRSCKPVIIGC